MKRTKTAMIAFFKGLAFCLLFCVIMNKMTMVAKAEPVDENVIAEAFEGVDIYDESKDPTHEIKVIVEYQNETYEFYSEESNTNAIQDILMNLPDCKWGILGSVCFPCEVNTEKVDNHDIFAVRMKYENDNYIPFHKAFAVHYKKMNFVQLKRGISSLSLLAY